MAQEAMGARVADKRAVPDLEVVDRPELAVTRRMVPVMVVELRPAFRRLAAVGQRGVAVEPFTVDAFGQWNPVDLLGVDRRRADHFGQREHEQRLAVEIAHDALGDDDADGYRSDDQQSVGQA
jgi:hypothetical protein